MKKPIALIIAMVVCVAMAGLVLAEEFGLDAPPSEQANFDTSGAYEGPYFVKRIAAGAETWKAVFSNGMEINSNRQCSNACAILSVAVASQLPVWIHRNSYGYIEAVSMGEAP